MPDDANPHILRMLEDTFSLGAAHIKYEATPQAKHSYIIYLINIFRLENLRTAMVLAKEHLNIPRVITPEDFANEALDELSSMTYLSYFVRHESPGYYHTLNWVCKQLRTTNITNLTVSKL